MASLRGRLLAPTWPEGHDSARHSPATPGPRAFSDTTWPARGILGRAPARFVGLNPGETDLARARGFACVRGTAGRRSGPRGSPPRVPAASAGRPNRSAANEPGGPPDTDSHVAAPRRRGTCRSQHVRRSPPTRRPAARSGRGEQIQGRRRAADRSAGSLECGGRFLRRPAWTAAARTFPSDSPGPPPDEAAASAGRHRIPRGVRSKGVGTCNTFIDRPGGIASCSSRLSPSPSRP
jgi:hypothetical protein